MGIIYDMLKESEEVKNNLPSNLSTEEIEKSYKDTITHINNVIKNSNRFVEILEKQISEHDKSKLKSPEIEIFAEYGPKLSQVEYGSDQYKEYLKEMKKGLDHHYANNMHHPEHYENGINDMTLFDIIEMLMDWKASCERTKDGNLQISLEINKKRFNIDDQLYKILVNTLKEM